MATSASSGRSALTVFGGHENVMRQTVITLAAGQKLGEHETLVRQRFTSYRDGFGSVLQVQRGRALRGICSSFLTAVTIWKHLKTPLSCCLSRKEISQVGLAHVHRRGRHGILTQRRIGWGV